MAFWLKIIVLGTFSSWTYIQREHFTESPGCRKAASVSYWGCLGAGVPSLWDKFRQSRTRRCETLGLHPQRAHASLVTLGLSTNFTAVPKAGITALGGVGQMSSEHPQPPSLCFTLPEKFGNPMWALSGLQGAVAGFQETDLVFACHQKCFLLSQDPDRLRHQVLHFSEFPSAPITTRGI